MDFLVQNTLTTLAIMAAMFALIAFGRRTGRRRLATDPAHARSGLAVIDASVFALLGLVIAFTFNGAGERLAMRRAHIGDELFVVENGYRKLDLLPSAAQPGMRALFRRYVDDRIAVYRAVPDRALVIARMKAADVTLREIWTQSVAVTASGEGASARHYLVPAVDRMIETGTRSWVLFVQHPPGIVYSVMVGLMLLTALLVGEGMAESQRPSRPHVVGIVIILAGLYFVILDLEHPMLGLIRLDGTLAALEELRRTLSP